VEPESHTCRPDHVSTFVGTLSYLAPVVRLDAPVSLLAFI